MWSSSSNWALMFHLSNPGCEALARLSNRQMAASSGNNIKVWDPLNNVVSPIVTFAGHTNIVRCLAASPDGSLLASGSSDTNVKLWSLVNGQTAALKTLSGHSNEVRALCFVSNQLLASGSFDTIIKIWNISSGRLCFIAVNTNEIFHYIY